MTLREKVGPATLGVAAAVAGAFYDPSAEAAEPKRVFGLLAAFVLLVLIAKKTARGHAAWWCAGGFVGWSAITLLWGVPSGLRDVETWTCGIALAAASASLGREGAIVAARWAGVLLGAASAGHAVIAFALGVRGFGLHGGQGNPNWLGLLLAPCLFVTADAALALRSARPRLALACGAAALLELAALGLSHSRVAWCAAAVGLAVFLVTRRSAVAMALAALVMLAPMRAAHAEPSDITDAPATDSLRGRAWIWEVSGDAALRSLPFGGGLGRFGHQFLDAQGERLGALPEAEAARHFVNATTAHDEPLQVLAESGVAGFALLLAAFALGVAALLRRDSGFRAGGAALVAVAVCALGDSPLRQPAVVFMVALIFATIAPSRPAPRLARYLGVALAALSAMLLVPATRTWLATRERTAALTGDAELRLARLEKSARLDPDSGESALSLGLARLDAGDTRGAFRELVRARGLLADVGIDVALGNVGMAEGRPADAERAYRRALGLDRGSFRAHANLAAALGAEGAFDEADTEADAARRLLPGHPLLAEITERLHRGRAEREAEDYPFRDSMSARKVAAASLSALAACVPPPSPPPHGLATETYESLRLGASQALACSVDDVAYEPLARGRHLFRGCGQEVEMLSLVVRGPAATTVAFPAPSNVYAKERTCELRRTTMQSFDDRTHAIGGCGAPVTYRLTCEGDECRWVAMETANDGGAKPAPERDGPNPNRLVHALKDTLTVEASSFYAGYPPSLLVDDNPETAWYSDAQDSSAKGHATWVQITFAEPVSVQRVTAVASRDPHYLTGYRVTSASLELRDERGSVLRRETDAVSAEADHDFVLPQQVPGVKIVRVLSITDEGDQNAYGDIALGELQVD